MEVLVDSNYLGGLHSRRVFFFDHVDDFIGDSEVLDGRSSDVALVHAPEVVTVSRCADNFLTIVSVP